MFCCKWSFFDSWMGLQKQKGDGYQQIPTNAVGEVFPDVPVWEPQEDEGTLYDQPESYVSVANPLIEFPE